MTMEAMGLFGVRLPRGLHGATVLLSLALLRSIDFQAFQDAGAVLQQCVAIRLVLLIGVEKNEQREVITG